MRINSNPGGEPAVSESSRPAASPSSASGAAASSSGVGSRAGEDQAQLSGAHVLVQALAAEAAQLPEIREAKVSALRQAVQSGNYQANPAQVANALFSHLVAQAA